jgi:cell division protease FtsH
MRNSLIYLLIVVAVIMAFFLFFDSGPLDGAQEIPISEVVELAENPGNERVLIEVDGNDLTVIVGANTFVSRKEPGSSTVELLGSVSDQGNVSIEVKESGSGLGSFASLLINFLPLILFGGILLFMMRQAQGSSNQAMGFGRSRARMFVGTKATVTFFAVRRVSGWNSEGPRCGFSRARRLDRDGDTRKGDVRLEFRRRLVGAIPPRQATAAGGGLSR